MTTKAQKTESVKSETSTKADKAIKPAKVDKPAKVKKVKTPGVIATIVKGIEDSGTEGITKAEILEKLVVAFPERDPAAMKKTINVQVPSRISKEKFKVTRIEDRYIKA